MPDRPRRDPADALVVFGASGDLAARKIFPALYALCRDGHLELPVIGVARTRWDDDGLRAHVRDSLEADGVAVDPTVRERLLARLHYVSGDYSDEATFAALGRALVTARRPMHYLAIPPALFPAVIGSLGAAGLAKDARVVVEKPFGRDGASARELDRAARSVFAPDSIYRDEADVAPGSEVETFVAARLAIDSWRWAGVPFYLRSGKRLAETACEVLVRLKAPPQPLFDDAVHADAAVNQLRFELSPGNAIALAARVKRPGKAFVGDAREMCLSRHDAGAEWPYERLLGDALAGDDALFARQEAVEAAWAVVEPVLADRPTALRYAPGSWGPAQADALLAAGERWHAPRAGA